MELSFVLSLLCLLQFTPVVLPSQPNMDLKLREDVMAAHHLSKIFHPPTSSCILRKSLADPLKLGPCSKSDAWRYTPQKLLMIEGTYFCLQAVGPGKPVKLSIICTPSDSQWKVVADSKKTHLATELASGSTVCLDIDSNLTVTSNPCSSFGSEDGQWFKIIKGDASLR